ncbi:MAG TPA: hypothetical protein VGG40_04410, partial [Solirubrobacterales bacterium]
MGDRRQDPLTRPVVGVEDAAYAPLERPSSGETESTDGPHPSSTWAYEGRGLGGHLDEVAF